MTDQRTADGSDVRARIDRFLAESGLLRRGTTVVPLSGGRVRQALLPRVAPGRAVPGVGGAPGRHTFDALSFVNIARLLAAMPVPVPRILGHSDEVGIIALEDLGDVTLQAHVCAASPDEHAALYRQAVTFITRFNAGAGNWRPLAACRTELLSM